MLAFGDGEFDEIERNPGAADQLNQNIDLRISRHVHDILTHLSSAVIMLSVLSASTNVSHAERLPGT